MQHYQFQIIETKDQELWERVVRSFPSTYYHSWAYCNALAESQKTEVMLLIVSEAASQNTVAIGTLSSRTYNASTIDAFTPYGYGGISSMRVNNRAFENELIQFMHSSGFTSYYIQQHPLHDDLNLLKKYRKFNNEIFIWDITPNRNALWSGLSKGHKYEIKKVEKINDFEITYDAVSTFEEFFELYRQSLERVEASDVYYFSKKFLMELLSDSNSMYLAAKVKGKLEAATLFLNNGNSSEYFISATSQEGRNYTRSLIWHAMEKLKTVGIEAINLGGGVKKGDFLAQFKSRFGANSQNLQTIQLITNAENYKLQSQKNGSTDHNYFPTYWKNGR